MRPFAASALLLLAACATAPPPAAPAPQDPGKPVRNHAERITGAKGVENFAKVHEGLYRGAQPTDEGFKELKSRGVKTVICLRQLHSRKKEVEAAGMAYLEIPLQANLLGSEPPTDEQVRVFLETVLDPVRQPVYFHCAHGKDRTGTMAALYRIEVDGWTPEEAIEEMQAFGYHDIFKDLIDYVRKYKPRGFKR